MGHFDKCPSHAKYDHLCIMQRRCHITTILYCFKFVNCSRRGAVMQPDILGIDNFVENSYQYDTMELLERHKALTILLEINVCRHILMVIIVCSVYMHCVVVTSIYFLCGEVKTVEY